MAEGTQPKWEGKSFVELIGPTADQMWPFLEDFCNIHVWFPNLDTCYQVEGVLGQRGLIRYCASTNSSDGGTTISWIKEKLLMINPIERCLSFEVLDNNYGIKSYVATIKVLPIQGDGKNGCKIESSFIADPIKGWRFEDFVAYVDDCLQSMPKKVKDSLLCTDDQ